MKVNAQTFFNFCAGHVPLLRQMAERAGELSEPEIAGLIREHTLSQEELPDTTWRRLKELQILVPTEPGSGYYLLAEPVARLLTYLFDEANPATAEIVSGYIASLETLGGQLLHAIEADNITFVGLAFHEINNTLRKIHADLDETQRAVQNEVATFKANREHVSVRDRYRRIVYWMERFVEPMVDIVRPDGSMAAAFEETERLLRLAREQALFNDHPALERNLRYLRLVRQHALRVFQECRKEFQPLYESLRRSSFIATGAAIALERLQREGIGNWVAESVIGMCGLRVLQVPGDAAISLALRRVIEHPPEQAPVIAFDESAEVPPGVVRQRWLNSLSSEVIPCLPLDDLLQWLAGRYPDKSTSEILTAFSRLLFQDTIRARFSEQSERDYRTADGTLHGNPLQIELA